MHEKPVTVLYLVTELDVGGAERNLFELARRIDRARFRPVVAALKGGGAISGWLADAGIPVHDLGVRSRLDLACVFRLAKLLRDEKVDVLHSFLFHANLIGRLAAAFARVPVVISSVRVAERERPWHVWLDGATSWLVDVETCVSDSVARFTHDRAGVPWRKLVTIRNGVDLSRFATTRSEARLRLNLDPEAPVIIFVGRLVWQKGADLIPRIVRRVLSRVPNARFLIVGAGPLKDEVERRCRRMASSSSVDFLGVRDDVPILLAAADVLILPSRWEGFANVILEAQAALTPVVVTDVEGIREAIEPGRTGVVVKSGEPDAFADAVVALLRDPGRCRALAQAARSRVGELLTVERMVEANFSLYQALLRRKGSG